MTKLKVLVGEFVTESNAHVPGKATIADYDIAFGDDCIRKMRIKSVFDREDVELIPAIYANAGPSGVIKRTAFDYIESAFTDTVLDHLDEIDGMFLMLHGASEVEGLGSGDHHILKSIRKIVGPYMPITVACDPHGNLTKEYVESTTVIRDYRQSPHTDADETMQIVAQMLCDILKDRQTIHSVYRKLPLILGGEQSVSGDEPVASINKYIDNIETNDQRIRSISWHVGYIRHDTAVAGSGIVVVPQDEKSQAYAETIADRVATYVWKKRHEFHYTGITAQPEAAINRALDFQGKPVFLTDSGDNVTSGATGWNTFILRQFIGKSNLKKRVLFATICDPVTFEQLITIPDGQSADIQLGIGYDEWSAPVKLSVIVNSKDDINGFMMHDPKKTFAKVINVTLKDQPIDILIANNGWAMAEEQQFTRIGLSFSDYDIIVVKQGYIFPDLKKKGKLSIMSLTQGATLQDTKAIPFKRIMRPMYPLDNI